MLEHAEAAISLSTAQIPGLHGGGNYRTRAIVFGTKFVRGFSFSYTAPL